MTIGFLLCVCFLQGDLNLSAWSEYMQDHRDQKERFLYSYIGCEDLFRPMEEEASESMEDIHAFLDCIETPERAVQGISMLLMAHQKQAGAIPQIQPFLQDEDPWLRSVSAFTLATMEDRESIPVLLELLEDKDALCREYAIIALRELNAREAIPHIVRLLEDPFANCRAEALVALCCFEAMEYLPAMLELLQDKDFMVQIHASNILAFRGARGAVPDMIRLLSSPSHLVRSTAITALSLLCLEEDRDEIRQEAREVIPVLKRLLRDDHALCRARAAFSLANLKDPSGLPVALDLIRSEDNEITTLCVNTLCVLNQMDAVPMQARKRIKKLSRDKDPAMKHTAIKLLGDLKCVEAIPDLLLMVQEEDADLRHVAMEALIKIADPAALPGLMDLFEHDSNIVRNTAAGIIQHMNLPQSVPLLQDHLSQGKGNPYPIMTILFLLDEEETFLPILVERFSEFDPDSRKLALSILATCTEDDGSTLNSSSIKDPQLFLDLFEDPDTELDAAVLAGKLRIQGSQPFLIRLLKHPDPNYRASAARSLGFLRDMEALPLVVGLLEEDHVELVIREEAVFCVANILNEAGFGAYSSPELADRLNYPRNIHPVSFLPEKRMEDKILPWSGPERDRCVDRLTLLFQETDVYYSMLATYACLMLSAKERVPEVASLLGHDQLKMDEHNFRIILDFLERWATQENFPEENVPDLLRILKNNDGKCGNLAAILLGRLGVIEAEERLLERLKEALPDTIKERRWPTDLSSLEVTIWALGALKSERAVIYLMKVLHLIEETSDGEKIYAAMIADNTFPPSGKDLTWLERIAWRAAEALVAIGSSDIPSLPGFRDDPKHYAHAQAVWVLERIDCIMPTSEYWYMDDAYNSLWD